MKTILMTLIICLLGCTSSNNSFPVIGEAKKPGVKNEAGGISSGGGDTFPSDPIGVENARHIIVESKKDLQLLLNYMSWVYSLGEHSSEDKIFGGANTILDLLETVDIEILQDKPCKDSGGNDVDASVYASKPNAICISAFTIGSKLRKERARKEIQALLVHEMSHLLGTDEPEAVKLQRRVLTALETTKDWSTQDLLHRSSGELEHVLSKLRKLLDVFEKQSADDLVESQKAIKSNWLSSLRVFRKMPYSIFNNKETNFFDIHEIRAELALMYSRGESSHGSAQNVKNTYNKIFNGQSEVKVADYYENYLGYSYKGAYGDLFLKRIEGSEDLKSELLAIKNYLEDVSAHILDFK